MNIELLKARLLRSKLFKDSFWAVFGNGMGNAMMLLAGILIARFLGKDLYGEYGLVKTTMIYISSFATFGLGITSTKFIAQQIDRDEGRVRSIIKDSMLIAFAFSTFMALLLFVFANQLAVFLDNPHLSDAFRMLGCIIIFRALNTTQGGCLSGLKRFKEVARNSFLSGIFMLLLSVPLTYFFSLKGSLASLLLSQIFNYCINALTIKRVCRGIKITRYSNKKELITFSFPVALQESSIWVCNWICILLLTKLSSAGELGLYSAATQWNAIISTIPTLLSNVVLSYIASTTGKSTHNTLVKRMFALNFIATIIPFILVIIFANFIASIYGPSFVNLPNVLRILCLNAVLESCAYVFKAEYISANKAWIFSIFRILRDMLMVSLFFGLLKAHSGVDGAVMFSLTIVTSSSLYLIAIFAYYRLVIYMKK